MENITIKNISGDYRTLGSLRGNPGDTIRNFTLENITLKLEDEKLALGVVKNVTLKNVVVNGQPYAWPVATER